MDLLIFAHRSEASAFFKNNTYKKKGILYQGLSHCILITGQRKENVEKSLSLIFDFLNEHNISTIINLGICGHLESRDQIGKLSKVSKVIDGKNLEHPLYLLKDSNKQTTLVTHSNPLHDIKQSNHFALHASLVDCEAFYIAQFCQNNNYLFSCYKIVSDFSGEKTSKEEILKNIARYSQILWNEYKTNHLKSII